MRKKRFLSKKILHIIALAALSVSLISGQMQSVLAENPVEIVKIEDGRILFDTFYIEEGMPLSEIKLPEYKEGTLVWESEAYIPSEREVECVIIFTPNQDQNLENYKYLEGWDSVEKVVKAKVKVIVSSFQEENLDAITDTVENTSESNNEIINEMQEESNAEKDVIAEEEVIVDDNIVIEAEEVTAEENVDTEAEEVVAEENVVTEAEEVVAEENVVIEAEEVTAEENVDTEAEEITVEDNIVIEAEEVVAEENVVTEAEEVVAEENVVTEAEEEVTAEENLDTEIEEEIAEEENVDTEAEEEITDEDVINEVPAEIEVEDDTYEEVSDTNEMEEISEGTTIETPLEEVVDKNVKEETTDDSESTEDAAVSIETNEKETSATDIFNRDIEYSESDETITNTYEDLSDEEKLRIAEENHCSNGIVVSGENLPWYVQFRAYEVEESMFSINTDANVFQCFEFELWDLLNDTEYRIPDGEYVSVSIPVLEGYEYTVEHILESGAIEMITPTVNGSTLVFSTNTFSPFGIAGSTPIVGGDIIDDGYQIPSVQPTVTPTPQPTASAKPTATPTPKPTGSVGGQTVLVGDDIEIKNDASHEQQTNSNSTNSAYTNDNNTNSVNANTGSTNSNAAVNNSTIKAPVQTGDMTMILPFVILVVAAGVAIIVVLVLKKRKR